jgi:hypothetical protein
LLTSRELFDDAILSLPSGKDQIRRRPRFLPGLQSYLCFTVHLWYYNGVCEFGRKVAVSSNGKTANSGGKGEEEMQAASRRKIAPMRMSLQMQNAVQSFVQYFVQIAVQKQGLMTAEVRHRERTVPI